MKKKELDALKKQLLFKRESLNFSNDGEKVSAYAEGYKRFIDGSKTEREAVEYTIQILEKSGYKPFIAPFGVGSNSKKHCYRQLFKPSFYLYNGLHYARRNFL